MHFSPYDQEGRVHKGILVTDNGFWDTFRTVYPLLGLAYRKELGKIYMTIQMCIMHLYCHYCTCVTQVICYFYETFLYTYVCVGNMPCCRIYAFYSISYGAVHYLYLGDIVEGWLNAYREGGWLPAWASPGYRNCMVGTFADVVVADAVVKNIQGFDLETARLALKKDSFELPPAHAGNAFGKYLLSLSCPHQHSNLCISGN